MSQYEATCLIFSCSLLAGTYLMALPISKEAGKYDFIAGKEREKVKEGGSH